MDDRITCAECPRCKDVYPGELDKDGYHFYICGMSGNKVYKEPRRIKRISGNGHINLGVSGCGLYKSVEDAMSDMTESEIERWRKENENGNV